MPKEGHAASEQQNLGLRSGLSVSQAQHVQPPAYIACWGDELAPHGLKLGSTLCRLDN